MPSANRRDFISGTGSHLGRPNGGMEQTWRLEGQALGHHTQDAGQLVAVAGHFFLAGHSLGPFFVEEAMGPVEHALSEVSLHGERLGAWKGGLGARWSDEAGDGQQTFRPGGVG